MRLWMFVFFSILLAVGLSLPASTASTVPSHAQRPANVQGATPHPLADCFGYNGVQVDSLDDYACKAPRNLYFWVTLDNGVNGSFGDGVNVVWFKQHPDPGNFWVFETMFPKDNPRNNGRSVEIDTSPFGYCKVVFPSWTTMPTDCTDFTAGGAPGETHGLTLQEHNSLASFMDNMQDDNIPLADR